MKTWIFPILVLLLIIGAPGAYAQHNHNHMQAPLEPHAHDVEKGKQLYATCVSCHGENGEGNEALKAPSLSGQHEWYLRSQLNKYKSGTRGMHPEDELGLLMAPFAKALENEQAIHDVSAYLASLKSVKPKQTIQGNAARGKLLFASCAACHGNLGQGMPPVNAPAIRGLNDWYVQTQLKKFRKGIRGGPQDDIHARQMQAMSALINTEQEMNDIIAYLNAVNQQTL